MADYIKERNEAQNALYELLSNWSSNDGSGDIESPRLTLIEGVRLRIDEIQPEGEGIQFDVEGLTNTTDPINYAINRFLDEAAKQVHLKAPLYAINGKSSSAIPVKREDGSGYIVLPSDYLRLQEFKLVGWQRPVTEDIGLITQSDPEYLLQSSIHTRGGKAKPVCVILSRKITDSVVRIFDYYSLSASDTPEVESFVYVPLVTAENIQDNLIESLLWKCAEIFLDTTRQYDAAKMAELRFQKTLENIR